MAAVESAPDFVDTVLEPPAPAPVPATRRTRIVYCLALAGRVALLMQRDDVGTCSDRAVWLADNYPGRPLQLRKYDLNGMLLKSLRVSFPPADETYRGFLDLRMLAERDDGIELVFVKSHSAGLTLERYRLGS